MNRFAFRSTRSILCGLALPLAAAVAAPANTPPDAPAILEPRLDGQFVSGEDVHMAIGTFHDAEAGQHHRCTDFEIASPDGNELVWSARCLGDPGTRVHAHLGDGTFEGPRAGMRALSFDASYVLRVRVRDDSGSSETEWSAWSVRTFRTSAASAIQPLVIDDVASDPPPKWTDAGSAGVTLDEGSILRLETPSEQLLFALRGRHAENTSRLLRHEPVRLLLRAGSSGLSLPESDFRMWDESAREIAVALPAINLAPTEETRFWVSSNGSTYVDENQGESPRFAILARGAPVPWRAPKDYRVEVFAKGFRLPVNIAFVPAPRADSGAPYFYVTELYGGIKVVTRDGHVDDYATGLLNFDPAAPFPGPGERGVTGLAVDPSTGDLFASMMAEASDGSFEPRIVRLSSSDGGLHASTSSIVLSMAGTPQSASHQISNISIGPDGDLYVHVGDAMRWWVSQDLDSFLGKVLRMHPDGSPAALNPFYDATDGITARDYVYAYGYRNPFGGAWRAVDDSLYCVENGPAVDRMTRVVEGRNYQWDYSEESMFTYALYNWWPGAAPVGIAFVQDETFDGSGFPEWSRDRAYVTESGPTWAQGPQRTGKRIREFSFAPDGSVASDVPFVEYTGSEHASVSGIAAGPDGLYFADLYPDSPGAGPTDRGANVLRVRFVGGAQFAANAESGDPLVLHFDDTSTLSGIDSWEWSFGDGATSSLRSPVHRFETPGLTTVQLRVRSGEGAASVAGSVVLVGPQDGSGLAARYYADREMTQPLATRIDKRIAFDWRTAPPDSVPSSEFSVRWTGTIEPRFSQTYTFSTVAAGDVRLWIGDQLLIDDWIEHPRGRDNALMRLEAGKRYPLIVEYATVQSPADVYLYWQSESQEREIVPPEALIPVFRPRPLTRTP